MGRGGATTNPLLDFLRFDLKLAETSPQRLLVVIGGAVQRATGIIGQPHAFLPSAQRSKMRRTKARSLTFSPRRWSFWRICNCGAKPASLNRNRRLRSEGRARSLNSAIN